jgi:hypothetical protein
LKIHFARNLEMLGKSWNVKRGATLGMKIEIHIQGWSWRKGKEATFQTDSSARSCPGPWQCIHESCLRHSTRSSISEYCIFSHI